jgi:hypothetical protein
MASYPSLMLKFAAATGIAAMLWTAAPAVATERTAPASEAAATTKTAPSAIKRSASRRTRIAASHFDRRVSPVRSNLDCSGVWCGRQFVLMIGVGY